MGADDDHFLYFGYGSNLLGSRLRRSCPSAERFTIGKLQGHGLVFDRFSDRWFGATATIAPSEASHVWGVVWKISHSELTALDAQEGVSIGLYYPVDISVTCPEGKVHSCRSYRMFEFNVEDRRPSWVYKNIILTGAKENCLPDEYITALEEIPDNGYKGDVNFQAEQGLSPLST